MWEEDNSVQSQNSKSGFNFRNPLFLGGGLLVILFAVLAGYFFLQYNKAQKLLNSAGGISQEDVQKLTERVGQLIDLPKDETPQILNVSDKAKLISQPFFAKVENGDKILLYEKNRVAVLFRPSTNKIINFQTNITIGSEQTEATPIDEGVAGGATGAPGQSTVTPTLQTERKLTPQPSPTPEINL